MNNPENKKPFIFGLPPEILNTDRLTTEELASAVGQNTGNLAFQYAINEHLGSDLSCISWDKAPAIINAQTGIAVLPCANQLGVHVDLADLATLLQQVKRPMVAIGLGAQSDSYETMPEIPTGSIEWVKEIIAHSPSRYPNIAVRGRFTQRVLEKYDLAQHTVVLGCPSFFINPDPALGQKIQSHLKPIRRIAVAAGNPWENLAKLESSLAAMVTRTRGAYISQHPLAMLKIARGEASSLAPQPLSQIRDYICPEMTLNEFIEWTHCHARFFYSIPLWINHLSQFDFVIGTRIHGVMLALQAEIPALCITHDSRTLELCETMKIPHIQAHKVIDGISQDDLHRLFTFDPDEFDENRKKLANHYSNFLTGNGLHSISIIKYS